MPADQTFTASRNATWAPTLAYDYSGPQLPLAGARIAMQIRLYPGQPDDAELTIAAVPFAEGIVSGVAGSAGARRRLTLSPVFTSEQLTALPLTGERGSEDVFVFDIRINYPDGISEILSRGQFIVSPGVTTA